MFEILGVVTAIGLQSIRGVGPRGARALGGCSGEYCQESKRSLRHLEAERSAPTCRIRALETSRISVLKAVISLMSQVSKNPTHGSLTCRSSEHSKSLESHIGLEWEAWMFQTMYSSILYREEFAGPIVFLRLLLSSSQRGLLFTGRQFLQ